MVTLIDKILQGFAAVAGKIANQSHAHVVGHELLQHLTRKPGGELKKFLRHGLLGQSLL